MVDHVVSDLCEREPCGRLSIFTGPPGTGKTHLVRSILGVVREERQPRFVLVQPSDVKMLVSPSFIPAFVSFSKENNGPIVLVLEDADECLLPRGSDNVSQIRALLNLSDGLIGSVFDIRVIATTNAKRIEIDPAIKRSGRLCRQVEVGLLSTGHARSVFDRIAPGCGLGHGISEAMTLADVYARAREAMAERVAI